MDREDHTFISSPGSEATTVPAGVSTRIHTKIGNFRWAICALLFFGVMINYMDRQILGIFKMTLQKELGWTEVDYGHLVAAFQAAYAVGLLLVGRWVDRLGTRRGYSLAMIFWSLASMAHAAGRTLGQFVVARAALGVGEAGVFPTSIKCVAEWFPKKERALATGIFNAGTNAGAILTPIVAPMITVLLGWRWAFFTVGALGFVWLFFWLVVYARPEEHRRCGRAELDYIRSDPSESVQKIPWVRLLSFRQTWAFIIAKFLTDPIWWFYLFWVPDFLQRRHNLQLLQASLPLATIYLIAAFGSVAGGWISSSLIDRGSTINVSRKVAMLVCALCVPPIVFATRVEGLWSAVLIIRKSLHALFRHVSEPRGGLNRRHRRNGRRHWRNADRESCGSPARVDRKLHGAVLHRGFGVSARIGFRSSSGAEAGAGFDHRGDVNVGCWIQSHQRQSPGQLLAAKQKEKIDNQNNHHCQLQHKAAGLVELVHHKSV